MNRIIKFRAWLKEEKKMLHSPALYLDTQTLGIDADNFLKQTDLDEPPDYAETFEDEWLYIDFNWIELMQFTGLKDKNGKEIYEGDIVRLKVLREKPRKSGLFKWKYKYVFGEIQHLQGYFAIISGIMVYYIWDGELTSIEVIGNIWENPELIK